MPLAGYRSCLAWDVEDRSRLNQHHHKRQPGPRHPPCTCTGLEQQSRRNQRSPRSRGRTRRMWALLEQPREAACLCPRGRHERRLSPYDIPGAARITLQTDDEIAESDTVCPVCRHLSAVYHSEITAGPAGRVSRHARTLLWDPIQDFVGQAQPLVESLTTSSAWSKGSSP